MNGRRYRLCSAPPPLPLGTQARSAAISPSMLARKSSVCRTGNASRCADRAIRSAFLSGRNSHTPPSACW